MKEKRKSEFCDSTGAAICENDLIKIVRTKDNAVLAARDRIVFFNNKWEIQAFITYERYSLEKYIEMMKSGYFEIYIVGDYWAEKW